MKKSVRYRMVIFFFIFSIFIYSVFIFSIENKLTAKAEEYQTTFAELLNSVLLTAIEQNTLVVDDFLSDDSISNYTNEEIVNLLKEENKLVKGIDYFFLYYPSSHIFLGSEQDKFLDSNEEYIREVSKAIQLGKTINTDFIIDNSTAMYYIKPLYDSDGNVECVLNAKTTLETFKRKIENLDNESKLCDFRIIQNSATIYESPNFRLPKNYSQISNSKINLSFETYVAKNRILDLDKYYQKNKIIVCIFFFFIALKILMDMYNDERKDDATQNENNTLNTHVFSTTVGSIIVGILFILCTFFVQKENSSIAKHIDEEKMFILTINAYDAVMKNFDTYCVKTQSVYEKMNSDLENVSNLNEACEKVLKEYSEDITNAMRNSGYIKKSYLIMNNLDYKIYPEVSNNLIIKYDNKWFDDKPVYNKLYYADKYKYNDKNFHLFVYPIKFKNEIIGAYGFTILDSDLDNIIDYYLDCKIYALINNELYENNEHKLILENFDINEKIKENYGLLHATIEKEEKTYCYMKFDIFNKIFLGENNIKDYYKENAKISFIIIFVFIIFILTDIFTIKQFGKTIMQEDKK